MTKHNRQEALRWASTIQDGSELGIWSKRNDEGTWRLNYNGELVAWHDNQTYIIDDEYAELRKESIDTGRPIESIPKNNNEIIKVLTNYELYKFRLPLENLRIQPASPYADFKIDDKVIVWDGSIQVKRHFAGTDGDGRPQTWKNGATSFTANGNKTSWDSCKKYEGE